MSRSVTNREAYNSFFRTIYIYSILILVFEGLVVWTEKDQKLD